MRSSTRTTLFLLWCSIASCGGSERPLADRAVGQYDFVEARFTITGGADADTTLRAGQRGMFGNLILHPDRRLSGASGFFGTNAYMTGTWSVEDSQLRLHLDSIGSFPAPTSPVSAVLTNRTLSFSVTTVSPTLKRTYVVAMKTDLRNLLSAQESRFDESSRYATDVARLDFKGSAGVNRPTFQMGNRAFSAIVTHSRLPDARCAIAKSMKNPIDSTARDGEVACSLPPERDSLRIAYTWRRAS
jgi:hypothetical protein